MRIKTLLAGLVLVSCGGEVPSPDGSVGTNDGGPGPRVDATPLGDSGPPDSGAAGADGGGALGDAGPPLDDAGWDAGGPSVDAGAAPDAGPSDPGFYRNAVLAESGDPFCAFFDGRYIVYLPDQIRRNGARVGGRVVAFSSTNLVDWTREGAVFDNVDEAYGGDETIGLWAPEVLEQDGRYFLFYVNVMTGGADERIGNKDVVVVASNDPLDFRGGRSTVLLDGNAAFIDPSPFVDQSDGQLYLLFKFRGMWGSGSEARIRPMSGPRAFSGPATRLVHSDDVPNAFNIIEHPMMIRRGGTYFFLFNAGSGTDSTYRIAYMTANRPTGPFRGLTTLFRSDRDLSGDLSRTVIAPGAPSLVRDGAGADWMVYRQKSTLADTFADREVCIDAVELQPGPGRIVGEATRGRRRAAPVPR